MQTFKDANGNVWEIDLNLRTARDIRRRMQARADEFQNVDFLDYSTLLFTLNDPFFGADLLAAVCEPQFSKFGVADAEQFGALLRGKVYFDAREAFIAEYIDFFPEPATAEKMRAVVKENETARKAIDDAILAETTKRIKEVQQIAEESFGEQSSGKSGAPAELSPGSPN